jgi:hypothetical protein
MLSVSFCPQGKIRTYRHRLTGTVGAVSLTNIVRAGQPVAREVLLHRADAPTFARHDTHADTFASTPTQSE